jgi:hypothetical protein
LPAQPGDEVPAQPGQLAEGPPGERSRPGHRGPAGERKQAGAASRDTSPRRETCPAGVGGELAQPRKPARGPAERRGCWPTRVLKGTGPRRVRRSRPSQVRDGAGLAGVKLSPGPAGIKLPRPAQDIYAGQYPFNPAQLHYNPAWAWLIRPRLLLACFLIFLHI